MNIILEANRAALTYIFKFLLHFPDMSELIVSHKRNLLINISSFQQWKAISVLQQIYR